MDSYRLGFAFHHNQRTLVFGLILFATPNNDVSPCCTLTTLRIANLQLLRHLIKAKSVTIHQTADIFLAHLFFGFVNQPLVFQRREDFVVFYLYIHEIIILQVLEYKDSLLFFPAKPRCSIVLTSVQEISMPCMWFTDGVI